MEGREHQNTSFLILHWRILDLREKRCWGGGDTRTGTSARFQNSQAFVCHAQAGTFASIHIYTYISQYISRLPSCSYNLHILFAIQGVAGLFSASQ